MLELLVGEKLFPRLNPRFDDEFGEEEEEEEEEEEKEALQKAEHEKVLEKLSKDPRTPTAVLMGARRTCRDEPTAGS